MSCRELMDDNTPGNLDVARHLSEAAAMREESRVTLEIDWKVDDADLAEITQVLTLRLMFALFREHSCVSLCETDEYSRGKHRVMS